MRFTVFSFRAGGFQIRRNSASNRHNSATTKADESLSGGMRKRKDSPTERRGADAVKYTFFAMDFEVFALERLQSIWEHKVGWNLAESGVHPLRVEELIDKEADRQAVMSLPLGYPQTNGTLELRSLIASMYAEASPAHIQVTNGGSEANLITLMHLVQPADEVVVMMPNYLQVRGLGLALQAEVRHWMLVETRGKDDSRWAPDLDALRALVTDRTRAILICNPNNPTGARLTASELDEICRIADRAGAWVVSDEIYRGAELDGVETPTAWGRYERVIVTSGLSKAFALPGLRIGWVVALPALIEKLWGVHDYTTIAPGAINDRLARVALAPQRRGLLLVRTRGILRTNYPTLRRWIERRAASLTHVPPEAGAIAFVRYSHRIGSTRLVERIRDEQSVLVVPGDHFEMDGFLRIGFGCDPELLVPALERVGEVLDSVDDGSTRPAHAR
jgi:aspartate/methionine/tyrosine aminotransferase